MPKDLWTKPFPLALRRCEALMPSMHASQNDGPRIFFFVCVWVFLGGTIHSVTTSAADNCSIGARLWNKTYNNTIMSTNCLVANLLCFSVEWLGAYNGIDRCSAPLLALIDSTSYWSFWNSLFSNLVSWCFKPSQPQRIISGLRKTFIKRYMIERTNKTEIRQEKTEWESGELSGDFMDWNPV